MQHLFISREYPPSPYSTGGIGTYVEHITHLLAAAGESVHVIAQQWPGAARQRESREGGRLIVHRVAVDEPVEVSGLERDTHRSALRALRSSGVPAQAFMWNAAILAEWLIDRGSVDVVEAQEYEAPAYFLMARRHAGLGPARRVPIITHLHTPTEFILRANGWQRAAAEQAALIAAETFVIGAADALLCPSRFLAQIAEDRYQLAAGSVRVLPYPLLDTAAPSRDARTWREGSICYVGRMEPRKGVSEWLDAALAVAASDPGVRFACIGGDTWWPGEGERSVRESLLSRVPPDLGPRVTFIDAVPRSALAAHLAQARCAVVPSRWENFPYTCIEAMASGLPVLVSPAGGMVEMVEDGKTGWVAGGADAASLEAALRRALATDPGSLAQMGAAAASSIRERCDAGAIVAATLELRRDVMSAGARGVAPGSLPLALPDPTQTTPSATTRARLPGETMTLRQILSAPRPQQRAVIRRALASPGYIGKWLAWHLRRRR